MAHQHYQAYYQSFSNLLNHLFDFCQQDTEDALKIAIVPIESDYRQLITFSEIYYKLLPPGGASPKEAIASGDFITKASQSGLQKSEVEKFMRHLGIEVSELGDVPKIVAQNPLFNEYAQALENLRQTYCPQVTESLPIKSKWLDSFIREQAPPGTHERN